MRSLAGATAAWGYPAYVDHWEEVSRAGRSSVALDTWLHGWRYVSLNALVLTPAEAASLRVLTPPFGRLFDWATAGLLADRDWWSELAWPWPALELACLEPPHPDGRVSLYGRFDWLLDEDGTWQLVEYNADTPSGGREVAGLEAPIHALHSGAAAGLERLAPDFEERLARALLDRIAAERATGRAVARVGVVSNHDWLEDMAQAWWLARVLRAHGQAAVVGDVRDLEVRGGAVWLRGEPIQALYRFYPIERLYRHGIFAPLMESVAEHRLLLLNGLRGFLAQSKAVLAWLWEHRRDPALRPGDRALIEAHLPATVRAREPAGARLRPRGVVKHVNGREGDAVVFGETLDEAAWEARLLEGGYVVQRRVYPRAVEDVDVDELARTLAVAGPRYPCVGSFRIGGAFAGCYTRLGGPITSARATFVPTLAEAGPPAAVPAP